MADSRILLVLNISIIKAVWKIFKLSKQKILLPFSSKPKVSWPEQPAREEASPDTVLELKKPITL